MTNAAMECERDQDGGFFLEHKLVHYRQRHNWDCGLACVLMLLAERDRGHLLENFSAVSEQEGFGQSTWTVDLCYLLRRYGVPHEMFTTTLGVNEDFHTQGYYDKTLVKDRERVNRRFEEAESRGVPVRRASLPHGALLRQLRAGPIVLLTDANVLVCDLCKFNKLNTELRSCLPFSRQYLGHYVILVGYNLLKRKFLYRNPSFKDRLCAVSFSDLERARKSFGTDEDAVFIYRDYRES